MRQSRITEAYASRRDRLRVTFPAAHAFLLGLEDLEGIWVSTATNAHVYSGNRFLAYIKIAAPDLKPPSLLLSPRFNNRIADGAVDASQLLFPVAVNGLLGGSGAWWSKRAGGAVELTSGTPRNFFDALAARMAAV